MTQVTANPVAMQEFVTGMGTAKDTLADAQTTEAATVRAFLNVGSTGITGGYEIVGIGDGRPDPRARRGQGLGQGGPRRRHRG